MSLSAPILAVVHRVLNLGVAVFLTLLVCAVPALSQKTAKDPGTGPKYDLQTETKTKGVIEEINVLPMGTRKDFTELIVKVGDNKIHIYLCPEPYEKEMGINFSKGDQISVTGSKVKQEESEVILAREIERAGDRLLFRDDKGNPVWDWRTGK